MCVCVLRGEDERYTTHLAIMLFAKVSPLLVNVTEVVVVVVAVVVLVC